MINEYSQMLNGERWYPGRVTYPELTHLSCDINHRQVYTEVVIKEHTKGRVTILLPLFFPSLSPPTVPTHVTLATADDKC